MLDTANGTMQRWPGSDSVTWKINREIVVVLGWGRAILLQLAHPLVAAGVADHSSFRESGVTYLWRLRQTIAAMLDLTFGTEREALAAATGINAIHDRVVGVLREPVGVFSAGTPYSAHDPDLLRWVHATLVESLLIVYELFVEPLTPEEKERYVAETTAVEPLLGIPDGYLPANRETLDRYMVEMYRSGQICIGANARRLARKLLHPQYGAALWPLMWLFRFTTIGLLPPTIRTAYGLEWDPRHSRRLVRAARIVRALRRVLPPVLREWPAARQALANQERSAARDYGDVGPRLA
jgi:uncharacterized protein (DUF2236 family)